MIMFFVGLCCFPPLLLLMLCMYCSHAHPRVRRWGNFAALAICCHMVTWGVLVMFNLMYWQQVENNNGGASGYGNN